MAFPFVTACAGTYGPAPLIVERPDVPLWEFGLLSTVTLIDETDPHAFNGIAYKSAACEGSVLGYVDDCEDPPTKTPTDDGQDNIVRGCPFHLYAALSCKTTTLEQMAEEVGLVFNLGEQKAIENQVWTNVLAQTTSVVLNATSLSADAFTVVGAMAALESAIAACYGGRATFHADRGLVAYLRATRQIDLAGDHYETALGSKIAFYGGGPNSSPAGVAAPDGFAWVYATSEMTIRRGETVILPPDAAHRLQYINADGDLTNEPYILAERSYVPSIECCAFAALVCLAC